MTNRMKINRFMTVAFLLATVTGSALATTTRHYYIQAEDVTWNYAPSGQDLVHGGPILEVYFESLRFTGETFRILAKGVYLRSMMNRPSLSLQLPTAAA